MTLRDVRAHFVSRETEDDEELDLAEQAERLFRARRVRLRSGYDGYLVIEEEGGVIAAAAVAPDTSGGSVEFSVAVAPDHERKGLARLLVLQVIKFAKQWALDQELEADAVRVEAEVINQTAIPPLLRSLGFEDLGQHVWQKLVPIYGR